MGPRYSLRVRPLSPDSLTCAQKETDFIGRRIEEMDLLWRSREFWWVEGLNL